MPLRKQYENEMKALSNAFLRMSAVVISAVDTAYAALDTGDRVMATGVVEKYNEALRLEKEIEAACLSIIVRQQPVAAELRNLSAVFRMIAHLSYIAEVAANIASLTMGIPAQLAPRFGDIKKMAAAAREMVTDTIKAYTGESMVLADYVIRRHEIVDGYNTALRNEVALFISETPNDGDLGMAYYMIAKNIERLANQAVELAEWVKFSKTGLHKNVKIF